MWYFDIETDGLDDATRVWCGVFKNAETNRVIKYGPEQIPEMIDWLRKESPHLCGHNIISFDLPILKKLCGYEHQGAFTDTLLLSKLQNPDRFVPPHCPVKHKPHSLETWGYRVGRGKPVHGDWSQFSEAMLYRCTEDVEITQLVHQYLIKEGAKHDWEMAHRLTHKLFYILQKQEEHGWLIDTQQIEWNLKFLSRIKSLIRVYTEPILPMIREIEEKADPCVFEGFELEYKCVERAFTKKGTLNANVVKWLEKVGHHNIRGPFCRVNFRKISLDKPNELKAYLLEQGWQPMEWNLDDNGERRSAKLTKDERFEGVEGRLGRIICKYVACKHREGVIHGLMKHIRPDGRISSVVSGLANTGRAKHAVVVNIPSKDAFFGKHMRKMFKCSPGKVLIGCDAAGCQNRMLAARVGNPEFTKTLIEGKKEDKTSIHFVNQRAIAEKGYDVEIKLCKNLNYGCLFGASDTKLGAIIGGTQKDGAKIREAILGVAPGFKETLDVLTDEWRKNAKVKKNKWGKKQYNNGWIRGLDGRPIFIESEHMILVYMLQSDEAIMMSAAYCILYKWLTDNCYKWGEDWAFVNWNHDEMTCEVREEIALEVSILAELAIKKAGDFYKISCEQKGEAEIGCNWYDIH